MRSLGPFLSFVLLSGSAWSQTPICTNQNVEFSLQDNSAAGCKKLKLIGLYQLRLCDNSRGVLSAEGKTSQYLFVNDGRWMSRRDSLDYDHNVAESEILSMDLQGHTFTYWKTTTKMGKKRESVTLKCEGSIVDRG